jgi:hypothetical protein
MKVIKKEEKEKEVSKGVRGQKVGKDKKLKKNVYCLTKLAKKSYRSQHSTDSMR